MCPTDYTEIFCCGGKEISCQWSCHPSFMYLTFKSPREAVRGSAAFFLLVPSLGVGDVDRFTWRHVCLAQKFKKNYNKAAFKQEPVNMVLTRTSIPTIRSSPGLDVNNDETCPQTCSPPQLNLASQTGDTAEGTATGNSELWYVNSSTHHNLASAHG